MSDKPAAIARTTPELMDFGRHYVGGTLRGSFSVLNASSCESVRCYDLATCDLSETLPDWITLRGPEKKRHWQPGLVWEFTIRTDMPASRLLQMVLECDNGSARCQISADIRESSSQVGDLVVCEPPFDGETSWESMSAFVRILNGLPLRVHFLNCMSEIREVRPTTVMLHQCGLIECSAHFHAELAELVASGVNLVLLANEFYHGTTEAVNRIMHPFGMQMNGSGADEPGLSTEERTRRVCEWQGRYDQQPFETFGEDIREHELTRGVKRLHWYRPSPIVCTGGNAIPLVRNRKNSEECFAAVAQAGGLVAVVGQSLWSDLTSVGWPYDNDRFFANLLACGDAEMRMVSDTLRGSKLRREELAKRWRAKK